MKSRVKKVAKRLIGTKNLDKLLQYGRMRRHLRTVEAQVQQYGCGFYNFWEIGPYEDFWLRRFLLRPRLQPLVSGKRIAVISVFGHPDVAQRLRADFTIFFTGENLARFPAYSDHLFGTADLSLGFDYLDRPDYVRFPIWLLHCFDPEMDLAGISARLQQWTDNRADLLSRPAMVATLLASHDASGTRGWLADEFARYGRVVYGGHFRNSGSTVAPGWPAKLAFTRRYPFQICAENSDRVGYTTEKLFEAFAAGCIPIYSGSESPPEPDILCQRAILNYRPGSTAAIRRDLEGITKDSTRLRELRDQSPFVPTAARRIHRYYTDLEERLANQLA